MQTCYTDESYTAVDRQLKRRLILLFAVVAVLLGVFIWAMAARIEWAATAASILAGCFAVFFADLYCAPLLHYRRLVRTALSGRTHERAMEFFRMEPDRSVVDGVSCRSLIFLGEPDKHGSREVLLYWDEELPLPALVPGAAYTVRYTGKNIIGIQALSALREEESSRL